MVSPVMSVPGGNEEEMVMTTYSPDAFDERETELIQSVPRNGDDVVVGCMTPGDGGMGGSGTALLPERRFGMFPQTGCG